MKKVLLLAIACSGIVVMFSCKPSAEEAKKKLVDECTSAIPAGSISPDIAKEYCNCSIEMLLKKYTAEEVVEMNKKTFADPATRTKMMEDVKPCVETLMEKTKPQQQ
jgi:hypothetical protein